MAEAYKNAPGILKMKCMIWEPNPISERTSQDYTIVYNSTTIKSLPENIQRVLTTFDTPPYGVFLKEKFIYRDTFLKIGNEQLQSNRENMRAENGTPLFSSDFIASFPYIEHQTFRLNGSLFSPTIATPTALQQNVAGALDNSLSKWRYEERQVPFDHDGHVHGENDDTTNEHDWIDFIGMQNSDKDFETAIEASDNPLAGYVKDRKVRRFMPMQIAATSEQKNRVGADNDVSKPIHWICEKETPLYSGEDFFVEFVRIAYQTDIVPNSLSMQEEYSVIDAKYENTTSDFIKNAGVVELDAFGAVVKESADTYNLASQPYYVIEIGRHDPDHHYFIILAYNANPIFVHAGRFGVLQINDGDSNVPPKVVLPPDTVSRRLGIYKNVSCKQLMDQEALRVTVRQHFGKFIITFSGHEGSPWIVSRTDYLGVVDPEAENTTPESCGVPLTNVKESTVPLSIPSAKIQIGGGNLKCGFMFGPLHYQPTVTFLNPNAITVKGPIEETDINLMLGERGQAGGKPLFFQDAELYIETINGEIAPTRKILDDPLNKNTKWPIKAKGKDCNTTDASTYDVRNGEGLKISYIALDMATSLGSSPNIPTSTPDDDGGSSGGSGDGCSTDSDTGGDADDPADAPIPGAGQYIKWFNARFTISSGDAQVGGGTIPSGGTSPGAPRPAQAWRIPNCITPIATGWRMYVPANTSGHGMVPVNVANHVETFSHNWSYSDNAKVEHTGNIRFRVNLGTPSSLSNSSDVPAGSGDAPPGGTAASEAATDQSAFLMSLSDKTFFIRVYAWWEGGYMDCDGSNCPCRRPGGPGAGLNDNGRRCTFTGLAHGGEITIEGNTRYMDCQLFDYMKIMQDQYFLNSPFFDGMSDYFAVELIGDIAGFAKTPQGADPYAPGELMTSMSASSLTNSGEWTFPYSLTGENLFLIGYTLPSSYDILQNPFMKFGDGSKFDEALTKIGTLAGKVAYFDRFGTYRYDVRPDARYLSPAGAESRKPKCNFMASPHALPECGLLDLLALDTYSYKRAVGDVVNDILLVTATPQGEVLVKSVLSLPGRYDPNSPGYVGYTKRLLQMEGIFGSQQALETIADYYSKIVFKPPIVVSWQSMGVSHLQAMDIVTFTGLNDDLGFGTSNSESALPKPTLTLILTTVSGEIIPSSGTWRNKYEGEWLYGNVP